ARYGRPPSGRLCDRRAIEPDGPALSRAKTTRANPASFDLSRKIHLQRVTRRWGKGDSNCQSLSEGEVPETSNEALLGEVEEGVRRSTPSYGDRRFEFLLLNR